MKKLVVDASVAVKWFVPEIRSDSAVRLLDPEISLCAPDLILSELANTVWKKTRRNEITPQQASEILTAFQKLDIEILPSADLVPAALMLATSLGRTVYDSLYLTLAVARSTILVTADRKFHVTVKTSELAPYICWVEEDPQTP
ncbi:MAG TPA: type II toxin-antitoxin system VapC family toxin [Thermoanaerobaculia bacterium]|nr:type II toxin-antitoxin system VapC family toxin [Thermoanaerobaculia bacterium]